MGYTHYWNNPTWTKGQIRRMRARATHIIRLAGVPLAGGLGNPDTYPVNEKEGIQLNGLGDDSYEAFDLNFSRQGFNFCKTGEHPYDKVVVALLVAATYSNSDFTWSSDGNEDDHYEGMMLYDQALAYVEMEDI